MLQIRELIATLLAIAVIQLSKVRNANCSPASGVEFMLEGIRLPLWKGYKVIERAILFQFLPVGALVKRSKTPAPQAGSAGSNPARATRSTVICDGIFMGKYRFAKTDVCPIGGEMVLLRSSRTGRKKLVDRKTVQLITSCSNFASLSDHAKRFCKENQGSSPDYSSVISVLEEFATEGYLVDKESILSEVRRAGPSHLRDVRNQIQAVGLPHRGSPELLGRALRSFNAHANKFERSPRFIVVDDTASSDTRENNKSVIRKINQKYDNSCVYINREERREFARKLSRVSQVPPKVVEFGLLGDERSSFRPGAARNTLLLYTIGKSCLQVDTDTVCSVACPPDHNSGMACHENVDASEYWFHRNIKEARSNAETTNESLFAIHESVLGRPVLNIIKDTGFENEKIDFDKASLNFVHRFQSEASNVPVSLLGSLGDSGMHRYSNVDRLTLRGDSLNRLVRGDGYRQKLNTRTIIRAPTKLSISDGSFCMGMNIAIDGTSLVPPFLPVERNEDGVFGAILRSIQKQKFIGYHPYLIEHAPLESREHAYRAKAENIRAKPIRLATLLMWLINSYARKTSREKESDSFQALGRRLEIVGSTSPENFLSAVQSVGVSMLTQRVRAERKHLSSRDGPRYWKEDLQSYIESMIGSLLQEDHFVPVDVNGTHSTASGGRPLYQEYIRQYGRLLKHWPDLLEAGMKLLWNNQRIGTLM